MTNHPTERAEAARLLRRAAWLNREAGGESDAARRALLAKRATECEAKAMRLLGYRDEGQP